MPDDMKIGSIEDLTKEQRRALRTRARAQRRIAYGVKLCGAKTRQDGGRPCIRRAMPNGRCRNHGGMNPPWAERSPEVQARCLAALERDRERRKAEAAQRKAAKAQGRAETC